MPRAVNAISRANAEAAAGRHWRAKEILRGAIASGPVDPAVLEAYGRVLETLGDRVEAGKYLFLSGARDAGYAEPIALFVRRHRQNLVGQLPAAVRSQPFGGLPVVVQNELRDLGVRETAFGRRPHTRASPPTGWTGRLKTVGGILIALVAGFALLIGLAAMARAIWTFVTQ